MLAKKSYRTITLACLSAAGALVPIDSHAQIFKSKKKSEKQEQDYHYQTFSTTQPKEKRSGYAGDEAKFNFEKPLFAVPYEKNDRLYDYSKSPFFGHKRPPRRKGNGTMRLCKVCGIKHF